MTNLRGISDRSAGPSPDALALKLTGTTALEEDFARGMEVEVTVRGMVTGHAFEDKRDKSGNVSATVKFVKVAADELVEAKLIPKREAPSAQVTIEEAIAETAPVLDEMALKAWAAAESERTGMSVEVVTRDGDPVSVDEDGVITDPDPARPIRDPQVPEESWEQLNHEQQRDVLAKVERHQRLSEYIAGATTPTDREQGEALLEKVAGELQDTYGIELIPFEQVREADELVAPPTEPPPPPVTESSPPLPRERLEKRKAYLATKRALPAEMEEERQAEITEIERRLGGLGSAA